MNEVQWINNEVKGEIQLKTELVNILYKHLSEVLTKEEIGGLLEIPPDSKMGDYAMPCFALAKKMRKSPMMIAEDLKNILNQESLFQEVQAVSGYLNIFINRKWLTKFILEKALLEGYGSGKTDETTVVEYCSPNTNKPLHLGHLRNMAIGESISRILAYRGDKVVKTCVYNDRGVHICKSMLAYRDFGNGTTPEEKGIKSDHFVGDYYVQFDQQSKIDESYKEQAQEMLQKWEEGDQETIDLWKKMNQWAFDGYRETFKLFGTSFEREYYESEIYKFGRDIILKGLEEGVFKKREDGAVIADLTERGLDEKVLLRSNGTSVYIVQDVYLAKIKDDEFNYDRSIYVVGNEQEYHFKVLKELLNSLDENKGSNIHHLSYGMVELPEGKMKSREGTVVDGDDLILDTAKLAGDEIRKRYELSEDEINDRGLKISLAAIKYQLLKVETTKNMLFNPKEAIRFEGDTGPYILYSYARASSILRRSGDVAVTVQEWDANHAEAKLLNKINQFEDVIKVSSDKLMPSILAGYVFDLSQTFNEFYHECPVLNSDFAKERLALVAAFRNVAGIALSLLGIEKLEEM